MIKTERRGIRILVNIARIIVGVLFIFSGLVKANDPLGLSYKMQEFFDVWSQTPALTSFMHALDSFALPFSIIMITLEIVVGVALLIGWRGKFISWLLFLLIIFFTFLTGYAVLSGKIRTCGCFGDCIPLTAIQSFGKDIILCVLIVILLLWSSYIRPISQSVGGFFLIILSMVAVLFLQWYVLRHLPIVDCLPFKKGHNLVELRKMPLDAIPDKVDFIFVYQKDGKHKEFSKDKLPDSTWAFIKRQDIVIQKGKNNEPPIKDFYLNTTSGADTTEALLNQSGAYYLIFVKNILNDPDRWKNDFNNLFLAAKQTGRKIYVIANQPTEANDFFNVKNNFNVPVYSCDATALKTAARTDPSLYLMQGPIVVNKWGWADFKKGL